MNTINLGLAKLCALVIIGAILLISPDVGRMIFFAVLLCADLLYIISIKMEAYFEDHTV